MQVAKKNLPSRTACRFVFYFYPLDGRYARPLAVTLRTANVECRAIGHYHRARRNYFSHNEIIIFS